MLVLLGSAVLASPIPEPCGFCDDGSESGVVEPPSCPNPSILVSCKDFKLDEDRRTLLASCQDCQRAWNPTSLDLDEVLGNNNGNFEWGWGDFSQSAHGMGINSETSKLSGQLVKGDGHTRNDASVTLADRIQNDEGKLKFVKAD